MNTAVQVQTRPFVPADEAAVLELLNASLGGGPAGVRPAEFFRWKHLQNPFGASFMLVAEVDGRMVGLRAFMRWEFASGDRRFRAVRAVDTATHPEHQGQGIFSRLTLEALDALRDETDFVFNTPNEKSLPGYLKMGWQVVGQIPIWVRVRRPIRFAMKAREWRQATEGIAEMSSDAPRASEVLAHEEEIEGLMAEREISSGIATVRSPNYLRWRYAGAPLLDYRAVTDRERGRLEGFSIFRVRPRGGLVECTVAETIVAAHGVHAARAALRAAGRSARVDHMTSSFPPGSASLSAARRNGFVRVPGGMTLVVNPLGHRSDPDPLDLRSWALTLGDLEVF